MCESGPSSASFSPRTFSQTELLKMEMNSAAEDVMSDSSSSSVDSKSVATVSTTSTSASSQSAATHDDVILLSSALHELSMTTRKHGEMHAKVAECWNSLGLIRLHMQQDYLEAKVCHEHALHIYSLLHHHTESAITCHDLGYCHEKLQQRDVAMSYYERALSLLRQHMDSSHPRMIAVQRSMNRLLRA